MVVLNENQIKQFMSRNMKWIGWGNWIFAVKRVRAMSDGAYAAIDTSEIGQQFILTLPDIFMRMPTRQQENILIHEFMHGREKVRQDRVEEYCKKIRDAEEEKCMNDMTSLAQNWE